MEPEQEPEPELEPLGKQSIGQNYPIIIIKICRKSLLKEIFKDKKSYAF